MSLAKVLLVDDEVPFVETITKRLTKRKLDVIAAYGGQESLDELAKSTDVEVVRFLKSSGVDAGIVLEKLGARP